MLSLADFGQYMDWWGLLSLLVSAAAALVCITFHELAHGLVPGGWGIPPPKTPDGSPSTRSGTLTSSAW